MREFASSERIKKKCRLVARFKSYKKDYTPKDFEPGDEVVIFTKVVGEKRPVIFYHGNIHAIDSSVEVNGLEDPVPALVLSVKHQGEVEDGDSFLLQDVTSDRRTIRYTRVGHVDYLKKNNK